MICPLCGSPNQFVVDSRERPGNRIYRRRRCSGCGYRWTTYEIAELDLQKIQKAFLKVEVTLDTVRDAMAAVKPPEGANHEKSI